MQCRILCDIHPAKLVTWSLRVVLRSFVPVNNHWKKASSSSCAFSLSAVIDPMNIVSLDYLKLRKILHNMFAALFNKLSWDSVACVTSVICTSIAFILASRESILFVSLLIVFCWNSIFGICRFRYAINHFRLVLYNHSSFPPIFVTCL